MTKQFSNYSDLITFTRASGGHALRPVSYGTELVTNGDYSDGTTGWTNDSGLTMDTFEVDSGRLHIGNTAGTTQAAYTDDNISLVAGKIYRFTAELEKVSGNDNWDIDIRSVGVGPVRYTMTSTATTETLQVIFVATQTENTVIQITTRDTFEGYIDNVSVKEVFFDQPDGTLTLFEHPDDIPRVEWDSAGNRLGLLVEEARTNLITYSEAFDSWSTAPTAASFELTTALSPSQQSAYLLKDTTNNVEHVTKSPYFSITSGNDYSLSVFVKKQTKSIIRVGAENIGALPARVFFDVDAGQVTTESLGTGSIQDVGNGWYRCIVVGTASSSVTTRMEINVVSTGTTVVYAGDETGLYVYGAQVEAGSFPTSYIKNEGTPSGATRSADLANIPVADFGYNQSAGTIVVEGNYRFDASGSSFPRIVEIGNSTTSVNRILIFASETSDRAVYTAISNNVQQTSISLVNNATDGILEASKLAFVFENNNFIGVADGVVKGTDTSGTVVPSVPRDNLGIGRSAAGTADFITGHFKSIKYYPRALTEAQLQALTEPRSTPTLSLTFDGQESSYKENYIHG